MNKKDQSMNKIEKFFLGCVIGALPPLTAFLIAWWSMYTVLTGWKIIAIPVAAALFGLVVDAFQLKRWIEGAYRTRWSAWVVVYLFYSTCVFGFFMGVPVFNLVLALPAGFYISCRLVAQKVGEEQGEKIILRVKLFTTVITGLVCTASAILALRDPYTGANLEGMLRLSFEMTQGMIVVLILVGGVGVLAFNWWLTALTIQFTRRWKAKVATLSV